MMKLVDTKNRTFLNAINIINIYIYIYFFLIILFFLFNYIIVTLWVPSVTRYAFLMASTSLILIMYINFIVNANGYFCIM